MNRLGKNLNFQIQSGIISNNETEQLLFTEHALETRNNDDERETANNEDKSFILAPFNSLDEHFVQDN